MVPASRKAGIMKTDVTTGAFKCRGIALYTGYPLQYFKVALYCRYSILTVIFQFFHPVLHILHQSTVYCQEVGKESGQHGLEADSQQY